MIISLRVQSGVQRRRHISVHIQPSPTAFLVFTRGAHPKPTRLNLNRRGCVMGFVAAMVTGLLFTSAFTSKIALFRAGYPLQCFDTRTLVEILFIYPLLIFRWKHPSIWSDPNRSIISKYLFNRGSWYPAYNANTMEQAQIDLQKENFHLCVCLFGLTL